MARQDFVETPNTSEVSFFSEDFSYALTPELVEYKSSLMSSALGSDKGEVENALQLGFEDSVTKQIKFEVITKLADNRRNDTLQTIMSDGSEEDIFRIAQESLLNQAIVDDSNVPEIDSFIFTRDPNSEFSRVDQLHQHRLEVTKRLFAEQMQDSSGGILAGIGYFADLLVSTPRDILEGGGFTRGNFSEKIRSMLTDSSITEKEFQNQVRDMIQEASDVGLFSDNNWFYTATLLDNFEQQSSLGDEIFTVLDAGLIKANVLKHLTKARSATDVVSVTKSFEEAVATTARQALNDTTDPEIARHTAPASINPMKPSIQLAGPDVPTLQAIENNNNAMKILREMDFGFYLQKGALDEVLPAMIEELGELSKGTSRYLNHNVVVDTNLGNILGVVEFGTSKGTPFKSLKKAQDFADEVGGTVSKSISDSKEVYSVRVETNIGTKGVALPTDESEITSSIFNRLGSTFLTSSKRLDAILKRGEGQLGAVERLISKEYRRAKSAVSSSDFLTIDKILLDYRDGAKSATRNPITLPEFKSEFKRVSGKDASESVVNSFLKIQELNDTTYFLTANRFFREAVDAGEEILTLNDSVGLRVRKVTPDDITSNRQIFDPDTGRVLSKDDLGGKTVYAVNGGYDVDGVKYAFVATSKPKTRRLFHTDVLDYNAGGPRIYTDIKKFVKQDSTLDFADGVSLAARPTTFLGVVTEKEARLAADEINNLFNRLTNDLELKGLTREDTVTVLRSKVGNKDFQDLIDGNTNFNKNIDDVEDLADFLEQYGLDINKSVSIASDNDLIRTKNSDGIFAYEGGFGTIDETYRDAFIKANNKRSRRDAPLVGYGGERPQIFTPIEGIERSFTRAINGKAEEAYVFNAVNGWLKGAEPYIKNKADILGKRPYEAMKNAVLGDTKEAKAFVQERNVIQRRVENQDGFSRVWQETAQDIGDYVYDKGYKKAGISFNNMFSTDPTVALRSIAFDLKLGLFAFPQLIVQSSHLFPIMAVAGKHGMQGALSYLPIRMALFNGSEQMTKHLGKVAGPLLGLEPKQFEELVGFIKNSGRNIIDQTVIEQSQDFNLGLGMVNKVRKAGRVFFNEGELIPRIAALTASYKDFLAKFPGQSLDSQEAILWVTNRQDVLTAGMTRASATAWQRNSLLSVPTQFLSYSSRMLEQIFSPKILTVNERRRLAITQLAMWGASGYGLGQGVNYLMEEGYIELDRSTYTLLRYGIPDWIIGETTGGRTAFAERLSIGEGFYDIWEKITRGQFLEVVGGPSVSITGDAVTSVYQALGNAVHGRFDMTTYDVSKVLRNLSSVNTAYNSWFLSTVGEYYARNSGSMIADQLGNSEAILNLMGAPLQDVSLGYDLIKIRKAEDEHLLTHGRNLQELVNLAQSKFQEGDYEGSTAILEEVSLKVGILNPYQLQKVKRFLKPSTMSMLESLILQTLKEPTRRGSKLGELLAEDREAN